jgi:DeoR family transcriptional regulator, suf operon transcriptional repressor
MVVKNAINAYSPYMSSQPGRLDAWNWGAGTVSRVRVGANCEEGRWIMGSDIIPSDTAILDLLRKRERLSVTELADAMEVTATAVRQRLTRLMAQGYIERVVSRAGRGRPSHQYSLTSKGRRQTGSNFADLAVALWQEIRSIRDPEVRRGLMKRISQRLAGVYGDRFRGGTLEQRMECLVEVMGERQVPFEIDRSGGLPVLNALSCPYPELAEMDRGICAMEREFLAEVLGEDVRLGKCRLDGDTCCAFEVKVGASRGGDW